MGVAVIGNKVVVSMAPDIVVYTDLNGDRRFDPAVDKREVLLTGFNGRVHDHTVHSVTVGPDGQWYWNAGNCGAVFTDRSGKTFRIGSPYDPYYGNKSSGDLGWNPREIAGQKSDDGHVWIGGFAARMNPDGSGVHIIGHNFRNSYEQTVTSFGDVFQNDNDDPPACRTSFLLEYGNAGFASIDGKRSWQADRRPGQSTAISQWRQEDPGTMPSGDVYGGGSPTGIAFVEESALGKKYRGMLLSCEPARNVVFGYFPTPEKAGFKLERFSFLTSNPEEKFAGADFKGGDQSVSRETRTLFRPSDAAVGPDGAIYVSDWFDPRVGGHNDMDTNLAGAIYRIAPKNFVPKIAPINMETLEGQLAAFKSPAVNVRGTAFHALIAQGKKAVKPVARLLSDENRFVRARAVWLLSNLGPDGIDRIKPLLKDANEENRIVAFRALRRQNHEIMNTAGELANDPSPAVRREVALAMRDQKKEDALPILIKLARSFDGVDRTYLEAWGTGATGKESALYPELLRAFQAASPEQWPPTLAQLAWRLHPAESVAAFRQRALSASLPLQARKAALVAIAYNTDRPAAEAVLEIAEKGDASIKTDAIWWLLNKKNSNWKSHGLDQALKARKLYDPENIEIFEATIPASETPKYTPAAVLSLKGDVRRGEEKAAICFTCHRIGEAGTEYGPNLTGWAKRQTPEVLFQSIINPSADIAHGFGGSEIKTKKEETIHGLIVADEDPIIIQSAAGMVQTIPKDRVASKKGLSRSLMLSADQLGLEPQDLADIAEFLRTK